ncbi:MAG: hypothetical protein K2N13_10025 [Paraprevotella sp.]|nr:hypothetical protein [Paraprevotella sp.]
MKKRFLLSGFIATVFCAGMQAQIKTVTLHNDDLITEDRHYEIPVINYDDNTVSISADTIIYNATVVVKDISGRIIHQEQTVINPNETEIKMAKEELANKSSVEVYYGDKRLYGYFEE